MAYFVQQQQQQRSLAMMQGSDQSSLATLLDQATHQPMGPPRDPPSRAMPPAYDTGPSGFLPPDNNALTRVDPLKGEQQMQALQQAQQRAQQQEAEKASRYGTLAFQRLLVSSPEEVSVPQDLPFLLTFPEDEDRLSDYQLLLRKHIEFFRADNENFLPYCSGRRSRDNPVRRGQIGIRCIHCKHERHKDRKRGSVYFPSRLTDVYQAAQNMGSSHFGQAEESNGCPSMPAVITTEFRQYAWTSRSYAGTGKDYWAKTAQRRGLVDTDSGIRFIRDL
jgi:hypothetical protein